MAQPRTSTDPNAAPARRRSKPSGPRRTTTPRTNGAAASAGTDLAALRTQLVASVREHYPGADLAPVERAFDLAVEAHEGQKRATGEREELSLESALARLTS